MPIPFVIIAAACLGHAAPEVVPVDRVDVIEVNHYYDEDGKRVFVQAIFRVWDGKEGRHDVAAWRLEKHPAVVQPAGRGRRACIFAGENGAAMRVDCRTVIHTWTQHDPELDERNILPREQRRGIGGHR